MNRYKIYTVNGLGHKKEFTEVLADQFEKKLYGLIFYTCQYSWTGKLKSREEVSVLSYTGNYFVEKV